MQDIAPLSGIEFKCPVLENLAITSSRISSDWIQEFLKGSPKVKSLYFSYPFFTAAEFMLESHASIEYLALSSTTISKLFAKSCPNLSKILLANNQYLSSVDIRNCDKLEYLDQSFCGSLKDYSFDIPMAQIKDSRGEEYKIFQRRKN